MRRLLPLFLTGLLILALAGCGGNETSPAQTADMEAMQTALLAADPTLPEMRSITGQVGDAETLFTYVSDLPYEKVDDFLLSYSAEGKADAVKQALQDFVTHEQMSMEHYLEDQYQIAKAAKVEVLPSGEVVLVCCKNSDAVLSAIKTALAA